MRLEEEKKILCIVTHKMRIYRSFSEIETVVPKKKSIGKRKIISGCPKSFTFCP